MMGPDLNAIRVLQWSYERDPELRGLEPRQFKPRMVKTGPKLIEATCSTCGTTYRALRAASADRPATFSLTGDVLRLRCARCSALTDELGWETPETVESTPDRSPGWP